MSNPQQLSATSATDSQRTVLPSSQKKTSQRAPCAVHGNVLANLSPKRRRHETTDQQSKRKKNRQAVVPTLAASKQPVIRKPDRHKEPSRTLSVNNLLCLDNVHNRIQPSED